MLRSPLSQFDILSVYTLFFRNYEVSITNLSLTIIFVLILAYFILYIFFVGHIIPRA